MKRPPLPPARAVLAGLACVLALLAAGGCKTGASSPAAANAPGSPAAANGGDPVGAVPDKDRFKVVAETTGFYRYSPLQAAGSDLDLKKGTRLTMVKRGRGYSQIKTPDNQTGYVGTEDIGPLSPEEIAQENAAMLQAAQAAAGAQMSVPITTPTGKRSTAVEGGYTIPPDAGNNERLPEPDARPTPKPTPAPTPAVNFR